MERFLGAIKQRAAGLDERRGQPRFATVSSFDPQTYTARVLLQPEAVLTGWLPILTAWMGAGWGMASPPSPGDQVLVLAQEGDAEHGVIVGRTFSDASAPPSAPVGELWLVHKSGSFIKLANDGTVQVQGDLHVAGDVYDRHGSLDRLRQHYDAHTHTDSHGDTTSTPQPQD